VKVLSSELSQVLLQANGFLDELVREELAIKTFSKQEVAQAVLDFYEMQGRKRPEIIWLENPWQLNYAPALFTGYKRRQILVYDYIEELTKSIRQSLNKEMGIGETTYLYDAIQPNSPARTLMWLSRIVGTEIEILDHQGDGRPLKIWDSMVKRLLSIQIDPSAKPRLERGIMDKLGNNLGWYSLVHYTGEEPPWGHVFAPTDMSFSSPRARNMLMEWAMDWDTGLRRPPQEPAPHVPPPGFEWSHYLRIQAAFPAIVKRFIGLNTSNAQNEAIAVFQNLAEKVHAIGCFPEVCFLSEQPIELHRDGMGRFHRTDGPAIAYNGEFKIYCWHNTRMQRDVLEGPVDQHRIMKENNSEVKRVLLERYGIEEYIRDTGAIPMHEDETGVLYCISGYSQAPGSIIMLVAVTNSTPEIDGTYKRYFLRVPPETLTAREGVAWTFHLEESEYEPMVET
jgi:hypothetical protein